MKIKRVLQTLAPMVYRFSLELLYPLNLLFVYLRKDVKYPNSVLHISYMVHIPYYTVLILRRLGMKADYLAVGSSNLWNRSDYVTPTSRLPFVKAWLEFVFFWRIIAKYEVLHLHFMKTMSQDGWEVPLLKQMGRKIVIHYRGCEIREREKNMALHPKINICSECEYNPRPCEGQEARRELARWYGDHFFVTTPDMLDFVPQAEYMPFFLPEIDFDAYRIRERNSKRFKIVHATTHPGIEGTSHIKAAIQRLQERGYKIEFVFLHLVSPETILHEFASADLAIGKMKMGYYANAQIESMFLGIPTITYVRSEFMTDELRESGFIFSTLDELEQTLEYYLVNPDALAQKRAIARASILRLHDNDVLGRRLVNLYDQLKLN